MGNKIYIVILGTVLFFIFLLYQQYKRAKKGEIATFDTLDWKLVEQGPEYKSWKSPNLPVTISAKHFADDSNKLDYNPNDISSIRSYFRTSIKQQEGGLVKVEKKDIKGIQTIQSIVKIPTKPSGMAYIGTIYFLLEKSMYVIKVQAREAGTTGMRDTFVFSKLMMEGKVSYHEDSINGWAADPYDSTYREGSLMNLADAEKYDTKFPDHPLSQVRMVIEKINQSIEFKK